VLCKNNHEIIFNDDEDVSFTVEKLGSTIRGTLKGKKDDFCRLNSNPGVSFSDNKTFAGDALRFWTCAQKSHAMELKIMAYNLEFTFGRKRK